MKTIISMKTIIRTGICLVMFAYMATPAKAFVFSDIPAFAQRLANMLLEAKNWIDTTTHYKEMVDHIQEFQRYKNQFDGYYKTFNRVYARVASGDYTKAFDVTKWDWKHLDDHILRTWSSWNQAWWDAQRLTLMTGELVKNNPAYKKSLLSGYKSNIINCLGADSSGKEQLCSENT